MAGEFRSLKGQLLLDSGQLRGSFFHRSVVLICHHDSDGAFGLVLNQPTEKKVGDVLVADLPETVKEQTLFIGGPVQTDALTYLHTDSFIPDANVLPNAINVNANSDYTFVGFSAISGVGSINKSGNGKLAIRDGSRIVRVDVDAIQWIDAAGDYMCVHANDTTHVLRGTMHDLEQRLDSQRFQRVHRSTIVNLARVKELRPHQNGEYFLVLDSGHELKLSRSYKDKVRLLT